MNSKAFYVIAAIATAAAAISTGAQADEADGSQYAARFDGSRARAEVQAEAVQAVRLGLTSRGEVGIDAQKFDGSRSRAEVRAEAVEAVRLGTTSHGEVGIYAFQFDGSRNRAEVQAEAVQAVRMSRTARGELGLL